ncbi:MAG TPA: hypothetical protein VIN11_02360, partial [Roseivirga sp.]
KTDILTDGGKQTDPVKKVQVIRDIIESISLIPDGIKRSVYISACANLLDVEEQVLLSELNKLIIQKQKKDRKNEAYQEQPEAPLPVEQPQEKPSVSSLAYPVERECLRLVVNYGNELFDDEMTIAEFILGETESINFENQLIEHGLNLAAQIIHEGKKLEPDLFIGPDDPAMSSLVIDLLEMKYFVSEAWEKKHRISTIHESEDLPNAAYSAILRLKRKKLESLIHQNEETLKKSKNTDEQDELLKMHMHLKQMLKEINDELGTVISS